MSIHAHLNAEAEARLAAQRRNSTITSFVISILVVLLIFLVLGLLFLDPFVKENPTIITYAGTSETEDKMVEKKVTSQIERKPSAPASSQAKVITSNAPSPVSIPVPEINVVTPSADFGDGEDFGDGWGSGGDGFGGGGGFGKVPGGIKQRCSKEDRMARLQEMGGKPECEDAVIKALDYLQQTQLPNGSWTNEHPVAMTGFALLAYLGHCETPVSDKYGDTVLKAITFLTDVGLKGEGRLSNKELTNIQWVYDHGIASYALAEAYTFCKSIEYDVPDLDKVVKLAIERIKAGQGDSGGWVYTFASTNSGDNSVGFWQIQAMKAALHTELFSPAKFKKPGRKAIEFLERVQGADGAIGYREDSKRSPGLTGGGVLCMQLWDEGKSKAAKKGIEYLEDHSKFTWGTHDANLYYHYYNAQALINQGGRAWEKYNEGFRDALLKAQGADGSWNQTMSHGPANQHMATCLATLMLEVYYRFLPGTGKK